MNIKAIVLVAAMITSGCATVKSNGISNSWKGEKSPVTKAIGRTVENSDKVVIAVVATMALTNPGYRSVDMTEWKRSTIEAVAGTLEQEVLDLYGSADNFRMVERGNLNKVMDELALSATLEISDEDRVRLGHLVGATHLVILNLARHGAQGSEYEILNMRFVETESGRLLAAQSQSAEVK